MPDNAHTEQPLADNTHLPAALYWSLWFPVFAVTIWGMMLLFGRRPWKFEPDTPLIPPPPMESPMDPPGISPPDDPPAA